MNKRVAITKELETVLSKVNDSEIEQFIDAIIAAPQIFIAAAGRSGFMANGFAMRLMHMGFKAYKVGETTTPSAKASDLLIVCSGSGETESLKAITAKAVRLGMDIATITINTAGTIAKTSKAVIQIPAPTEKMENNSFTSIQPMGNLFEQGMLILLDSIVMDIMDKKALTSGDMFKNHANLE